MRIALVHSFYDSTQPSGENAVVMSELEALRAAGHDVRLIASRTDDLRVQMGYPVRAAIRVLTGRGRSPVAAINDHRPDIVHVHNLFPNFGTTWLRDLRIPAVATLHNFRTICAAATLQRRGGECTDCLSKRLSAVRHRCYRGSALATIPLAVASQPPGRADVLRSVDRLLVLNDYSRELFIRVGVSQTRLHRVDNFVLDKDRPAAGEGGGPWIFAGRLTPEKGIDRLLGIWPGDEQLDVVGSGPLEGTIEQVASEAVTFNGQLPRTAVLNLMSRASGLVFPSTWREGFPLVYAEAMAAGLPVVAYEGSAVADLVRRDGTGVVVRWEDGSAGLRRALHAARRVSRSACGAAFESRYSEAAFVRSRIALYRSVIAEAVGGKTG